MGEPEPGSGGQAAVMGSARSRLGNDALPQEPVADVYGVKGAQMWTESKGWDDATGQELTSMSKGAMVTQVNMTSDLGTAQVVGYEGTIALWTSKGWSQPSPQPTNGG